MMTRRATFLTYALALLPWQGLSAQTTQPLNPAEDWARQIRNAESQAAGIPEVNATSPEQIVKFSAIDDLITVATDLAPPHEEVKVVTADLKGIIRIRGFAADLDPGLHRAGRRFQFVQQDFTDPQRGESITTISSIAGRVLISRDIENGQSILSVQLMENPPDADDGAAAQNSVRLMVHKTGPDSEFKIDLTANSFSELRMAHRSEVDAYLRPIIRSFRQEPQVFAIPDAIGWQALGSDLIDDDAMAAMVQAILPKLNVDDFRQRQLAIDQLRSLGRPAIQLLAKLDRNALSLQQNAEIGALIAESAPLAKEQSDALATDKSFLLDVLYSDDALLRGAALKRLGEITHSQVELDSTLDSRERVHAIELLRQRLISTTRPTGSE